MDQDEKTPASTSYTPWIVIAPVYFILAIAIGATFATNRRRDERREQWAEAFERTRMSIDSSYAEFATHLRALKDSAAACRTTPECKP